MEDELNTNKGEMIVYEAEGGGPKLEVRLHNESLWLSQSEMARLFQCTTDNISFHLTNIYKEGELSSEATTEEFSVVRREGTRDVQRTLALHNLDAIISVGYRIKSRLATQFRIWATQRLREYIVKGFVMDDERLKNPPGPDVPDYFNEMLERIRDIRSSEKRVYLRVREIFAMAADYVPNTKDTTKFYSAIQNKLHFAVTGMTGPEIIKQRAHHNKPDMGLTSHKHPSIRKSDVTVAKNYLAETEIDELNRIVVMWLDFAEDQAKRRKQVFLGEWESKLDDFLRFNDRKVLTNLGTTKKAVADEHAIKEYDQFAAVRRKQVEKEAEKDYLNQLQTAVKALTKRSKKEK